MTITIGVDKGFDLVVRKNSKEGKREVGGESQGNQIDLLNKPMQTCKKANDSIHIVLLNRFSTTRRNLNFKYDHVASLKWIDMKYC